MSKVTIEELCKLFAGNLGIGNAVDVPFNYNAASNTVRVFIKGIVIGIHFNTKGCLGVPGEANKMYIVDEDSNYYTDDFYNINDLKGLLIKYKIL